MRLRRGLSAPGPLPTGDLRDELGVPLHHRELIALLRRDDQLRHRWVEVRARGFSGFGELVGLFVAAGVLRAPASPDTLERLAKLCWPISEF